MVENFFLILFASFVIVSQIEANYDEIGSSCRHQLEFFKNGLDIQQDWALKC